MKRAFYLGISFAFDIHHDHKLVLEMTDIDYYINFTLHAVLGYHRVADELMRRAPNAIRRIAAYLAATQNVPAKPLYRGLFLEPGVGLTATYAKYWSWSEDKGVAEWFAARESTMSIDIMEKHPDLLGYIIELSTPAHVLFHWKWAAAFDGLASLALFNPTMGPEGERQIAWALQTQKEVITEPISCGAPVRVDVDAARLVELEARLCLPNDAEVSLIMFID